MVKAQSGSRQKHYTIPVFIPGIACPFQCIFCDQEKITGHHNLPTPEEVLQTIRQHLSTIPDPGSITEIGFFGGTFTGLPLNTQEMYLNLVRPFLKEGSVSGIRLSTRPDYITFGILDHLQKYQVTTIELGAQSMHDVVLRSSFRGHSSAETEKSASMIKKRGFSLGLQMMIGLPGDSEDTDRLTVEKFIEMEADFVRVYPVLVIRGTPLETLFKSGEYRPLTLEEAVSRAKNVLQVFDLHSIPVIRMGLHPSDGLLNHTDLVAGPFHPSFREFVLTSIWYDRILGSINGIVNRKITITVNPSDLNHAIGYYGRNRNALLERFEKVVFKSDPSLEVKEFHVDYY